MTEEKLEDVKKGLSFAPQNKIAELEPYVVRVLKAVEHPKAWVSDMSSIGDFRPVDETYDKYVARISVKLGFIVKKGDSIIDLAMRLKAKSSSA